MKKLDKEEKDLVKSFEDGEWNSIKTVFKKKKELVKVAKYTAAKNKRINIRLSEKDLANLKAKSLEKGLPYQTLVASVIHRYISGKFKNA